MRLSAVFMTAALAVSPVYGQTPATDVKPAAQPAETEPQEAEIIHVKTLTGDSFDRLVKLLVVFSVRLAADGQLRTIVVYGPKDVVAQMRRVVTELDTPGSEAAIGRNIEMTMTFLRCSVKVPATVKVLPDDIEPVAKQLRATTQYKDIELWDVLPLRLQEGKQTTESMQLPADEQLFAPGTHGPNTTLDLQILPDAASRKGQTWSVRFGRMNMAFKVPLRTDGSGFNWQTMALNTSGDFLEGQKTVLGKISGAENDTAIFVVISLKVLD